MMKLTVKSFIAPKKGETAADCQDAKAQNESIDRYAIADGATLSFFPRQWADLLVKHFCYPREIFLSLEEDNWEVWIEPIQREWLEWVSTTVQETRDYMLVDRLSKRESALSTFIGIEFNIDKGEWKALILGDSCLFHQRGSEFKSYLLERISDFQYRPKSFASFQQDNPIGGPPEIISDDVLPGDLFILATDALAKWIVQHNEISEDKLETALNQLKKIKNSEQFDQFVDLARDQEEIRLINDDVTLMLISVEESETIETKTDAMETSSEEKVSQGDVELHVNVFEIIFWVLITGFFSIWSFYGFYRFLRDLILTFIL